MNPTYSIDRNFHPDRMLLLLGALCLFQTASAQSVSNLPDSFYNRDGLEKMPHIDYTSMKVVNVQDMGAKGDGQTDDTNAFNKAVERLSSNGGIVYVPEGIYYFAEPPAPLRNGWQPKNSDGTSLHNIHFVGVGDKSVILFKHTVDYRYRTSFYGWSMGAAKDCSFRDLRFSSEPLFDQRWWPGIGVYPLAFNGSENIQVLRVTVDQGEIGICFWRPSHDAWVVGCAVRNTGADGIHFENSVRATAAYNLIENSGDDGIATLGEHSPPGPDSPDAETDNRFIYNTVIGVSWGRGILAGGSKMEIVGNWLEGAVYMGVYLSSRVENSNPPVDFPITDGLIARNTVIRCDLCTRPDRGIRGPSQLGAMLLEWSIPTAQVVQNRLVENQGDGIFFSRINSDEIAIRENGFVNNIGAAVGVRLAANSGIKSLLLSDNVFEGNKGGIVVLSGPAPGQTTPSDLTSLTQKTASEPPSPFAKMETAADETGWQPLDQADSSRLPEINVRDFGAKGDGKTDDTAAFLQAIAKTPSDGALLKIPAGTYLLLPPAGQDHSPDTAVPHTLQIAEKNHLHLVGEGAGTVLVVQSRDTNGLRFLGCDDCSLESFKMVCGDPPAYRTNRSLIEIAACDGVMLRHLDLSGSGGPGIFINASRRVEAGDCAVADAGMEGISVGASRQVSIHDCRIDRSRDHGIKVTWVGSIDRSPQYVRIEKNKIADVQQGAGIGLLSGDNVEVVGNEIHGGRLGGIAIYEKARLFSHQHIHVAKNSIDHSPAGTPTYVTGAISVWNLIYANVDPARIDLTIEENHFGDGVSVPIWVGLKSSSLHSLTLKDNVMDSGAPVSATFDEPDLVGKNIAQHSP